MSTTPEHPQNPPQGGFPPPPPPGGGGSHAGGSHDGPSTGGAYGGPVAGGAYGGPAAGGPPPGGGPGGLGGPGGPGGPGGYGPPGGGGGYGPGGYGPPGAPGYPPSGVGPGAPLSPSDQRTWAIVSHLSGIFVSVIGPLVVWLVFRGRGAYLEDQSREALNFQITILLAYVVGGVLSIVGIGLLLMFAAWVATIVFGILAAVASSRGEPYRYPVTLRLVS